MKDSTDRQLQLQLVHKYSKKTSQQAITRGCQSTNVAHADENLDVVARSVEIVDPVDAVMSSQDVASVQDGATTVRSGNHEEDLVRDGVGLGNVAADNPDTDSVSGSGFVSGSVSGSGSVEWAPSTTLKLSNLFAFKICNL